MRPKLASVLLCIFFVVAVPKQQARAVDHNPQPSKDQRGTESSPAVVKIAGTLTTEEEAADSEKKDERDTSFKRYELALTIFIAIAAIVQASAALIQIYIYRKQSRLMARSLATTKKAADAALLNAKAVINSERPWLLITPSSSPAGWEGHTLSTKYINQGNSPAAILFTHFDSCLLPFGKKLSLEKDPWLEDLGLSHVEWVEPQGKRYVQGSINSDPQQVAWLWGFVKYQGPMRDEAYESRFCYMWTPKGGFVMGGPRGYNDCT